MEHDDRVENLNKTKMLLYLFCQLVELVEGDQGQVDPLTGAKQKGKKKNKDDDYTWDWDVERNRSDSTFFMGLNVKFVNLLKFYSLGA